MSDFIDSFSQRLKTRCMRKNTNCRLPKGVVVNCTDSFIISGCGTWRINQTWNEVALTNSEKHLRFKVKIMGRTNDSIRLSPFNFTGTAAEFYIRPMSQDSSLIFGRILVVSREIWKIIANQTGAARMNLLQKYIDSDPAIYELFVDYGVVDRLDWQF